MQGGSRDSFWSRSHGRLIGLCAALALGLCAVATLALSGLGSASTALGSASQARTYIAAGDSITFGITDEKSKVNSPNEAPVYFEEGFDHFFDGKLNSSTELGKHVFDVNTACPDETSNEFVGENEALGGEKSTEPAPTRGDLHGPHDWHPCPYKNLKGLPLHDSLEEHSQLEEILSILGEGKEAHEVRAITINIGGADLLSTVATCEKEVIEEFEREGKSKWAESPELAVVHCIVITAENVTIPHLIHNLGSILSAIDSTGPGGGHYKHAIVVVGFYNPNAFVVPGSNTLIVDINRAIEQDLLPNFPNATFANPFPLFNKGATPAAEQASICKYTEMCNPNVQVEGGAPAGKDGDALPSLAGDLLLARLVNEAWLSNPAK